MSHDYIKKNYGACPGHHDSAYIRKQHYDSLHGDTLIFNFRKTCCCNDRMYSTGNCCRRGGSFWGGFVHGVVNFFGGYMSSMIMPMYGGFYNMLSPFSMIPGYLGLGGPDNSGRTSSNDDDTEVIGDGGNHNSTVITNNNDNNDGGSTISSVDSGNDGNVNNNTPHVVTIPNKIGGIDIPTNWNISQEDLQTLNDLGVKIVNKVKYSDSTPGLSLPKLGLDNPEDVKKLSDITSKYNIPIAFARNNSNVAVDHWMAGKVTVNSDGSYDIACQGVGMFGLTVTASKNGDGTWTIKHKSGTPNGSNKIYHNPNGVKYNYVANLQHLDITSIPLYSKNQRSGYYKEVK